MNETIKTNAKSYSPSTGALLSAIDFLRYKVAHGELTVGEYESLMRAFGETLDLQGTAEDFAAFYGKSKNNVRVAICRGTDVKPVRKVLYPFDKVVKAVPKSWHKG